MIVKKSWLYQRVKKFTPLYNWYYRAKYYLVFTVLRLRRVIYPSQMRALRNRSIIVIGPPRVGKSRVSQAVKALTGMPIVQLDDYRKQYRRISDSAAWKEIRRTYAARLATLRSLIIEGDELIIAEHRLWPESHEITFDLIEKYFMSSDITVIFVGCSETDVNQKVADLMYARNEKNCWTADRYQDDELNGLVSSIEAISRKMRQYCQNHPATYFELKTGASGDVREIANGVIAIALSENDAG